MLMYVCIVCVCVCVCVCIVCVCVYSVCVCIVCVCVYDVYCVNYLNFNSILTYVTMVTNHAYQPYADVYH